MELYANEAEVAVLGGIMLDDRAYDRVADVVCPDDFATEGHRRIMAVITQLAEAGQPVDCLTIGARLRDEGDLDDIGGLAYLTELAINTASSANIRHYAGIVQERACLRRLVTTAHRIAELAQDEGAVDEKLGQAQALLMALTDGKAAADVVELRSTMRECIGLLEARLDGEAAGVATGFPDLDAKTGGLKAGDLWIVAGRPSMGKTCFSTNIAENVAKRGVPVLIASLEMSRQQLCFRIMASLGGASLSALINGVPEPDELAKASAGGGLGATLPLLITETADTVAKLRLQARKLKRQRGLGLIVVDYLQLMTVPGAKAGNRVQELTEISRGLKMLAKELGVPVIALSQLNRGVEQRPDKRPMMSDLRESGAIEQDADVILMMYRDEYYHPDSDHNKGIAEAIIRKQRMGELGTVMLAFQGQHSRFRSLDRGSLSALYGQSAPARSAKVADLPRRGIAQ